MDEKIFTFEFEYRKDGTIEEIQFCSPSKEEASDLFDYWCLMDERVDNPYKVVSITPVWNDNDAMEYGDQYGTPDEYEADLEELYV